VVGLVHLEKPAGHRTPSRQEWVSGLNSTGQFLQGAQAVESAEGHGDCDCFAWGKRHLETRNARPSAFGTCMSVSKTQ
jgi:hypothetical protein